MTRAPYFFFVSAIYQYVERSGTGVGRDFDKLARDIQYELLKTHLRDRYAAIVSNGHRPLITTWLLSFRPRHRLT